MPVLFKHCLIIASAIWQSNLTSIHRPINNLYEKVPEQGQTLRTFVCEYLL